MKKITYKIVLGIVIFITILAINKTVNAAGTQGTTIVINPGHGGSFVGCANSAKGLVEKDITLKIANYLKEQLSQYYNVKIIMTHDGITFPKNDAGDLAARAMVARDNKADLYVSLHINDTTDTSIQGANVFVTSRTELPKYKEGMTELGNLILSNLSKLGIKNNGVTNNKLCQDNEPTYQYYDGSQADYYADIRYAMRGDTEDDYGQDFRDGSGVPTVLIEHCYINNSYDVQFLDSEEDLKKLAKADCDAIVEYFGLKLRSEVLAQTYTPEQIADLIFDYKFYADKYPDLKEIYGYNEVALKNHYKACGIKEGRQPSAVFDAKYYLANNADLKAVYGTSDYESAYQHFIKCGWQEQRPSSSEYYGKYYKEKYSDLAGFSTYDLIKHYLRCGRQEGRTATNIVSSVPTSNSTSYLFDATVYSEVNADLKKVYGNDEAKLKNHWEACGIKEGRTASLVFDAKYYLEKYPDIKAVYGNDYKKAYEHFVNCGIKEGRQGSQYFDAKYYLATYPDLQKAFGTDYTKALKHFMTNGIKEGRNGSATFKISAYKSNYADLKSAFGNENLQYYIHYIKCGAKEGRKCI